MKTFKQHLTELFDNPVKGRQMYDKDNDRLYEYHFVIEDRAYYVVIHGDKDFSGVYTYHISFGIEGVGGNSKVGDNRFKSTNVNKDQIKVLSTVIDRVHHYFEKLNPLNTKDKIKFTGEIERKSLYDKFAQHLMQKYDMWRWPSVSVQWMLEKN